MLERVAEPLWELGSPGIPGDFLLKVLRRLYLGPWSSSIIPPLSLHASDWVRWLASCSGRSGVKVPYSVLQIILSLLIVYIFLGALGTSHSSPAALWTPLIAKEECVCVKFSLKNSRDQICWVYKITSHPNLEVSWDLEILKKEDWIKRRNSLQI